MIQTIFLQAGAQGGGMQMILMFGGMFVIYDDAVVIETGAGKIKFEKAAISRELTAARYAKTTDKVEKAVEEKN